MRGYFISFIILFLLFRPLYGQPKKVSGYTAPLKIPFSFSGGFGELRRNHFHTGLDFRTSGQTGLPVYAVKEGYAARILVSPSGYGRALYLVHPDGHTSVYGHLLRFHPKIEEYLKTEQYRLRQFAVNLTIPPNLLSFQRGECIAWSGNSGSSGGPHLHFEIRNTETEKPQNPLFYLPGINDHSIPRITSLFIYPMSPGSSVNKGRRRQQVETLPSGKVTRLKNQAPLEVFGDIGIGIQTTDDFNGTGIKCGIYSAELFFDDEKVYSFKVDQLAFDQGRFVNSHIDYDELIRNKRWIHRLFRQPGNRMEMCHTDANRGILPVSDHKAHTVKVQVSDAFGNATTLSFKMVSKGSPLPVVQEEFTRQFQIDRPNKYVSDDLRLSIPEGALYDHLNFICKSETRPGNYLSGIHRIHNQYVPLHLPYDLSIRSHSIPQHLQNKALIVQINPTGSQSAIGGEFSDGWITAHPRAFGDFGVVLDTVPPVVRPLNIKGNTLTDKTKIEFRITDNLSGISSYEGLIDGNWALFEYDAKSDLLTYYIDKGRISTGKNHSLVLKVVDERKNIAVFKGGFYL